MREPPAPLIPIKELKQVVSDVVHVSKGSVSGRGGPNQAGFPEVEDHQKDF